MKSILISGSRAGVALLSLGYSMAYPLHVAAQKSSAVPTLPETVVSSVPLEQTLFESAQPVSIVSGQSLTQSVKGSLGETLSSQPGIASTSFGPGASRPVIRGLGGDRIRILENGIGTQDASNTSPDHAVSVEPLLAEKIEVVRGPASLLYGTSAVGGIVNVFDNRIPEALPEAPFSGKAEIRGGSNSSEHAEVVSLDAPVGPFAVHIDSSYRHSGDIRIPGYARTGEVRRNGPELEYPEPKGRLPYSQTETSSVGVGASYLFDSGFVGLSGSLYNTEYGVPNGEKNITVDGRRPKLDLHSRVENPLSGVSSVDLKVGYSDYRHTEFEDGEAGTKFKNRGYDARVEVAHDPFAGLEGVIGFQAQQGSFSAIGEESFQPPTDTDIFSAFLFENLPLSDDLRLEGGLRVDGSDLSADAEDGAIDRSFTTFSQSFGAVLNIAPSYALALSLAHTERAPSGQELFAGGPHIATAAFEVGDPDIGIERSVGVDLTLRREAGWVTGSIGGFYNRFNNYIALNPTGEQEDELAVYRFEGIPADFYGFESQVVFHLLSSDPQVQKREDLNVFIQPDYVWAENRDTGEALPRIPPLRIKTGIHYVKDRFSGTFDVRYVASQDRTADFETSTDSYTFVNLGITQGIEVQGQLLELFVRGENLTNEKGREHVSFIKDIAPLPGINVIAGMRLVF